jgi:hypothetical protein
MTKETYAFAAALWRGGSSLTVAAILEKSTNVICLRLVQ